MTPVSQLISRQAGSLIPGLGGSIGSELSTQIARSRPAILALVDVSELTCSNFGSAIPSAATAFMPIPRRGDLLGVYVRAGRWTKMLCAERPEIVLHAAAELDNTCAVQANVSVRNAADQRLGTHVTLDMFEITG